MKELKRILSKPRTVLALALIILVNAVLFVREQVKNDYGLDVSLPLGGTVIMFDTVTVTNETADARGAYEHYLQWIEKVRDMAPSDAAEYLRAQKDALADTIAADRDKSDGENIDEDARLDYAAVNSLIGRVDYIAGYGELLDNIRANKENLLSFSIFNKPGSFSSRNIIKTADEFEKLESVKLTLGADGAVDALLSFHMTDYLLTLALTLFALSFLEERRAGLWAVVHAFPRGRLRLAVKRTTILFFVAAAFVVILYGTDLILGFSVYGGIRDLGRAVQSVETLGRLPILTTVGGFLVRYFILRAAAAFLIGLLLWLLLSAVDNVKYALVAAAFAIAVEYSLYTFLPVQSAFNVFKYFNIFTYISLSDLYTDYLNVDIFSYPLGIRAVSQAALPFLCVLAASACIFVMCKKRPASGRDILGRAAYIINSVTDKLLRRFHMLGMELYKTLWIGKGVVIVALLAYTVTELTFSVSVPVKSLSEQTAREYTVEFSGLITDDTLSRMDAEQKRLEGDVAAYEDALLAYDRGELDYKHLNVLAAAASTAKTKLEGLAAVRERVQSLTALGKEYGIEPWLVDEIPFESVYGARAQYERRTAALTAVLALTLILAANVTYERQSGMTKLLAASARGRGALIERKLATAAIATAAVWLLVYGAELRTFMCDLTVTAWDAPVQCVAMMQKFPFHIMVKVWLVLLYLYRYVCLYCVAVVVLAVSSLASRTEAAYVAACAVTVVPSLLYAYMNIDALAPLSLIVPVEAMSLLIDAGGAVSALLAWSAALAAVTAVAIVWLFVSASGTSRRLSRT